MAIVIYDNFETTLNEQIFNMNQKHLKLQIFFSEKSARAKAKQFMLYNGAILLLHAAGNRI